ncbi:ArnT family glycosyltransferase [Legionella maioricensis]|uniref:Glycosyltransferase family 39 protein n=1 Tax=Legionella maioricensis TaxID=2896528 RepID=A0A9X2ID25_9GAMM|nr:glycosyltransferase family 39 protein [Legionella maioricensis]MCL9685806.1 glycosyltransferase family 39 protein [Legionella maioricensis]MCL9689228.1 glycosyltransferase family 39 protein [Legionella maioricensis]
MEKQNDELLQKNFFYSALFVLIFLLLCRIISNYFIPLNDTTEARYGEIARKMLETGNWVNLLHDYGIPFWAKPPLSTWLSALSMKLFGINEFAARLPGLFLSVGILALIGDLAKRHSGSNMATVSILVLAGTLFFFLDAGTVMTDPSLVFCTTLSMVAFWHAVVDKNKLWSYIFFIGLGLGLLAKGPLAVVLVGLPIFFWVLLRNQWVSLWKQLPWIKGTLLVLIIALPWYILAEIRTPGFLNYFIVGEHLNRFLVSGWTGDKYGFAHHAPKGMIWIYAVAGLFPWNVIGGGWLVKHGIKLPSLFQDEDGWMSYLCLCMLAPLVFFTFSSNIIYPYAFPCLPAFALFFAEIWSRSNRTLSSSKWILLLSALCGALFLIVTSVFIIKPDWLARTQKPVIEAWVNQHPEAGSNLVYWGPGADFSAQFYSGGKAKSTQSRQGLCKLLSNNLDNYLAIDSKLVAQIPKDLLLKFTLIKAVTHINKKTLLFYCPVLSC